MASGDAAAAADSRAGDSKASPKAMAVTKKDMDSNKNYMEHTKKGKKTEKKEE